MKCELPVAAVCLVWVTACLLVSGAWACRQCQGRGARASDGALHGAVAAGACSALYVPTPLCTSITPIFACF